ncbi:MAG TPA: hypothetical protein VLK65_17525 [Vicinamibacteria bacterium]|nr:hypothetical protein [Vicinamibacteria bacterium]
MPSNLLPKESWDRAFADLEDAYRERDPLLSFMGVDAAFDDLRADPRFLDVIRRLGLGSAGRLARRWSRRRFEA